MISPALWLFWLLPNKTLRTNSLVKACPGYTGQITIPPLTTKDSFWKKPNKSKSHSFAELNSRASVRDDKSGHRHGIL
jgi:hypothetical protein